ncbi:MAG: metallopeptidase family protein, partial [Gemmatimonadota bacterium]|nr:metallopeptidase family protein [Gemmatimonadota bacterium]
MPAAADAASQPRFGFPVNFRDFDRRAREIFDGIPPDFREGVDGIDVRPDAVPHPALPEIYTLGECLTEHYPSEFGGPGEVLSTVVLYHGSFRRLAELDPEWDWEQELWETVTHEVRHHLESLAADDALEVQDYAEDQNFARREGASFDPFFYRQGVRVEEGVW